MQYQLAFQIGSIFFSVLSGCISLSLTYLFDQKSIANQYGLSGKWAELRAKAEIEQILPSTEKEKIQALAKLKTEEAELNKKTDPYLRETPSTRRTRVVGKPDNSSGL
jgi:hypothetical protein